MFRKAIAITTFAAALALGACAGGPTPYQPGATATSYGYAEQKIEDARYRISFKGNSLTERDTVENYMLFRAAELTLQSGYDTFTVVKRDTDKDSRTRFGGVYGPRLSYMYFSPRWGWYGAWDPFWDLPSRRDTVTRYEAFAEIVMSKGPKGADPNSFDARQVQQNLAASVQRPAP